MVVGTRCLRFSMSSRVRLTTGGSQCEVVHNNRAGPDRHQPLAQAVQPHAAPLGAENASSSARIHFRERPSQWPRYRGLDNIANLDLAPVHSGLCPPPPFRFRGRRNEPQVCRMATHRKFATAPQGIQRQGPPAAPSRRPTLGSRSPATVDRCTAKSTNDKR